MFLRNVGVLHVFLFSHINSRPSSFDQFNFEDGISFYYEMLLRLYQTAVLQGRRAYHIMKNRYLFISKATRNIYVCVLLHSVLLVNLWVSLPEC
jgi:hypothetical protein